MVIKFNNVSYKDIFENINLEIGDNKIISLIGKNGSGKSMFLNLLYGIVTDFSGNININDEVINNKTKKKEIEKIRKDIFYLNQDYSSSLFNITIFEDIKYNISNVDLEKLQEYLKLLKLEKEILYKNYSELSDGQIKKILLIMMLISDNKIILLDDLTNGLDQKSISSIIKLLKKEKRNNKIIIVSSQDSEFLLNISDSVIMIYDKKLIKLENKYDFFSDENKLTKCGLHMPNVLLFRENVLQRKNIKLIYRDNINDLIKDIYRNA